MTRPGVAVAILLFALGCKKPVQPGDPLSGLFEQQLDRFARGKIVFDSVFTPATGLGPLFNSVACGECHEKPAGGRGDEVEVHATAFRGGVCDALVQEGGPVIQRHAIPALKQALGIDSEPFPPSATARALRTSPVVFGRGLLDFVPDSVILAYADPDDKDHDGVRGRPNRFVDGRMGRFGRKAFVPTLRESNAGAFVTEMGVTDPAQPTEENIGGKPIPAGVDAVAEPDGRLCPLPRAADAPEGGSGRTARPPGLLTDRVRRLPPPHAAHWAPGNARFAQSRVRRLHRPVAP